MGGRGVTPASRAWLLKPQVPVMSSHSAVGWMGAVAECSHGGGAGQELSSSRRGASVVLARHSAVPTQKCLPVVCGEVVAEMRQRLARLSGFHRDRVLQAEGLRQCLYRFAPQRIGSRWLHMIAAAGRLARRLPPARVDRSGLGKMLEAGR